MTSLDLVPFIVPDYDEATRFFVDELQFTLAEDRASQTTTGQPKRWIVVQPPHGGTGFVLARGAVSPRPLRELLGSARRSVRYTLNAPQSL
jgi:catechol 2,3-dioxygenase-like lactoylglutathione lyase family enzyme